MYTTVGNLSIKADTLTKVAACILGKGDVLIHFGGCPYICSLNLFDLKALYMLCHYFISEVGVCDAHLTVHIHII